jgi:hypothetical protein
MRIRAGRYVPKTPAMEVSGSDGRHSKWTEARIVRELRRLCAANVTLSCQALIDAGHVELARAINHFGGLQRLRRLFRLPRPRPKTPEPAVDRDVVLAEIGRRHDADEPLAWSKVPRRLRAGGEKHFGSWQGAIVAAGLDYAQVRLRPHGADTSSR